MIHSVLFTFDIADSAGIHSRFKIYEHGDAANMIEALHWKKGERHYPGLGKNPTEQKGLKTAGQGKE